LSRNPIAGYLALYASLGLDFTPKVQQTLQNSSQSGNPGELSKNRVHAVKLDSAANLSNWKKRLTEAEITRIRSFTAGVAAKFYPEESWE